MCNVLLILNLIYVSDRVVRGGETGLVLSQLRRPLEVRSVGIQRLIPVEAYQFRSWHRRAAREEGKALLDGDRFRSISSIEGLP